MYNSSTSFVRTMQPRISAQTKQRRSGYEPSDTETEWQESPWNEADKTDQDLDNVLQDQTRNKSPLKLDVKNAGKIEHGHGLTANPSGRRSSKSPTGLHRTISNRPVSPLSKSERKRHVSLYKTSMEDHHLESREITSSSRRFRQAGHDVIKVSDTSNYSRRFASAPRERLKDKDFIKTGSPIKSNLSRNERDFYNKQAHSGGEINEMLANVKIARDPTGQLASLESTDSIAPGDIFFSRDYAAFTKKNNVFTTNGETETSISEMPEFLTDLYSISPERNQANSGLNHNIGQISATRNVVSTQKTTNSNFGESRQSSNGNDLSSMMNWAARKFAANQQKSQRDAWFSCIKKGSCRTPKESPEKVRGHYEALVIEKASVVESLRQFWADKYRPTLLSGFICHKQQASHLKQLATREIPHILLKGPPGSGKKSLTMALLHEVYGDTAQNISHDLKYFNIKETRPMEVAVPISSSPHHVELNVNSEPNAMYALVALVKQISTDYAVIREISNVNMKADYKVMVLYDVDKAADKIQHLIKWIMDCYSDACKLILCCEDDVNILEHVKSRCRVIDVEAPATREIMEVLVQIARKEDFELPINFAARVANKSKQNMRRAIMALEACKAHIYPFVEDQPIPLEWEEVLVEISAGILADPSPKRLFYVRGKFQKLLVAFVHPKLILLKLVEQFLRGVDASSKRELHYWHAYYDKRLPSGTSALLKLEEFTAKFMSIHRKSFSRHQVS